MYLELGGGGGLDWRPWRLSQAWEVHKASFGGLWWRLVKFGAIWSIWEVFWCIWASFELVSELFECWSLDSFELSDWECISA